MSVIENLLNQATNPSNKSYDSDTLKVIKELINREPRDGICALRLLAHKIQSPQAGEALIALKVLEWLANNCEKSFIVELGKFRFLNEMIKVLIPQYLGDQTSPSVKSKCIELLHQWQRDFASDEPKFSQTYDMLRQQGIITDQSIKSATSGQTTNQDNRSQLDIFERNKQSARLTQLLRSSNPADVAEANRLIKAIVEEDNRRMEQVTQRSTEMETLKNNALLLDEMVNTFVAGSSSSSEVDLMEELAENMRKARQLLYDLPLTHQENDMQTMTEIAIICDRASSVLSRYQEKVRSACLIQLPAGSQQVQTQGENSVNGRNCDIDALLSAELGGPSQSPVKTCGEVEDLVKNLDPPTASSTASAADLVDIFSQLPVGGQVLQAPPTNNLLAIEMDVSRSMLTPCRPVDTRYQSLRQPLPNPLPVAGPKPRDPFNDLESICREMMSLSRPSEKVPDTSCSPAEMKKEDDHDEQLIPCGLATPPAECKPQPAPSADLPETTALTDAEWHSLDVPLSSIQPRPGRPSPRRLFPREEGGGEACQTPTGVQVHLHYTANQLSPDVVVFVAVVTNQGASSVSDLQTRFATTKPFQLRQLSMSASNLPAHSPFLPAATVSQVLLLRKPSSCQETTFALKFLLSFSLDDGDTVFETVQLTLPIT